MICRLCPGTHTIDAYDGRSGALVDTVGWIERGKVEDWGDPSGNRPSRRPGLRRDAEGTGDGEAA